MIFPLLGKLAASVAHWHGEERREAEEHGYGLVNSGWLPKKSLGQKTPSGLGQKWELEILRASLIPSFAAHDLSHFLGSCSSSE